MIYVSIRHRISVHRLRADCSPLSTGALHGHSQSVTIPDAVKIQFWPPEDEHGIARNMSRYLMQYIYYRITELCIKLVIKTSFYSYASFYIFIYIYALKRLILSLVYCRNFFLWDKFCVLHQFFFFDTPFVTRMPAVRLWRYVHWMKQLKNMSLVLKENFGNFAHAFKRHFIVYGSVDVKFCSFLIFRVNTGNGHLHSPADFPPKIRSPYYSFKLLLQCNIHEHEHFQETLDCFHCRFKYPGCW
jgi:hypothetical protein